MADQLAQLEVQYCPPIDSALFSAIVLDYDISNPASYEQLRATLDEIKGGALLEENTYFDPSGSNAPQDAHTSEGSSDRARSRHGETASRTSITEDSDLTSASLDLERVNLDAFLHDQSIEKLSHQEQLAALIEMFPEMKIFDVEWTFKKTHNDFGKAIEELLNQTFLEGAAENGVPLVKRGIEGFSESIHGPGHKRKKGKKFKTLTQSIEDHSPAIVPSPSRWLRVKEDIDFIEQRTFIPRDTISSRYHSCGASLPSTIAALVALAPSVANPTITEDSSSVLITHALDLAPEFPSLSYAQMTGLVHLSHPSKTSARELGQVLVSSPSSMAASPIIPQYLPRPPPENEASTEISSPVSGTLDPITAASLANKRSSAFEQAQSAYRKSKSNPHFGGAASYYSQIGRDASSSLRKHEAAAADQIVANQSKAGEVDLHGLYSRDAVRISRHRVETWWESEASEWARTGKAKGNFRIVTGQGHHSTGGRGVLGPAVFKALIADGWKVRMEQGYIVVSGKARK